jgi:hypothetical protein
MRSNQVDALQVMAQQDATVAGEGKGTVENRNRTKGKVYSLCRSVIRTRPRPQDELEGSPSTAAITTLSMAVSVAVVILYKVRTETTRK